MTRHSRTVLIVEDVGALAQTYKAYLRGEALDVETTGDGTSALTIASASPPDVLILDVNLPGLSGIEVLRELKKRAVPSEVVIVTSNGSVNLAVEAMREGAADFLVKPFSADRLRVTVRNAIERRTLADTVVRLREELGGERFCGFIGQSLRMQSTYRIVQSAASTKATVFITGESGTGKEVCAAALHSLSKRAAEPFIALNCAAIPRDLLESEVFGHVKGAYTGATGDRLGAVLSADKGTLFLDEIGEMDVSFQAKLLRFIESGSVQRVGEDRIRKTDVRIVCATNRDPLKEVAAGRFREDLFYRLHVIPVEMPPLRDREGDVLLLARHFLQKYGKRYEKLYNSLDRDAEDAMLRYAWPGNVRELKNVIQKIVVLGTGATVKLDDLPVEIQQAAAPTGARSSHALVAEFTAALHGDRSAGTASERSIVPLEEQIDRAIDDAIDICGGSIPRAAALLKVSPSTIYRRLNARLGRKLA